MMEPELLDFVKEMRLKVAPTTYHRKYWQIRAYLKNIAAKGKAFTEATRQDVEAFLLSLRCSRQFRQSVCCTVREFYEFHRITENPAAGIEFKRDDSYHLPAVPPKAAVNAIIERLAQGDDDLRIRDRLMMELAYGSALRRDELRKVNIEDIDLEGQTVRVTGKGNKTRIVPLTSKAAGIVREYLARRKAARGPLLVSFMGRRLSCNGVYSVMRNRVGMRPHLLRHACATHMLANGASIRVIQELLGHSDLKATQFYTAIEKGNLSRIVNQKHPRNRGNLLSS
jgi:integrase/recombinase XerC